MHSKRFTDNSDGYGDNDNRNDGNNSNDNGDIPVVIVIAIPLTIVRYTMILVSKTVGTIMMISAIITATNTEAIIMIK